MIQDDEPGCPSLYLLRSAKKQQYRCVVPDTSCITLEGNDTCLLEIAEERAMTASGPKTNHFAISPRDHRSV